MNQTDPDSREGLSRESLQRLTSFLLVVSASLLTAVIALFAYIAWDRHQLAELKGSLLAQQQLQRELLANQDSDHAPYPHIVPGISYVLNPAMQHATWKTGAHQAYRINSLGLRGQDIKAKAKGVKRIALVGDSVLFGWKLNDSDTLASLLQAMVDQRLGAGRYEFVTIAIPGWNILDQALFLRSHLARLAPDYIVWSIIRNDLLDSAGVTPPGLLMAWNSPQKTAEQGFNFLPPGQFMDAPVPAILSRWETNLALINDFSREHDIPTSLLWWRAQHRPLLDYIMARVEFDLPMLHIPGQYRYDDDNWCVAFPDCHPTRWANERLALGVMGELVDRGAVTQFALSEGEQAVLEAFRMERDQPSTPDQQRAFMEEQAAKAPRQYQADGPSPVVFGVRRGRMERNGIMLLRQPGDDLSLEMEIAQIWQRSGPPLTIDIRIHSSKGVVAETTYTLADPSNRIRIDFPGGADFDLYQVEWLFSYSECERPTACYSAELLSASLLDSPGK